MSWAHFPLDDTEASVTFNPDEFGFMGAWPLALWDAMQTQFVKGSSLATGSALIDQDKATLKEKYPLRINLWDFVAEIHATIVVGEEGLLPPRTIFAGQGKRDQSRAAKFMDLIKKMWDASKPSKLFTAFYNTQVFGGCPLTLRLTQNRTFPVVVDIQSPLYFYPVFDSSGDILEYFIHKEITHREAHWKYRVEVESSERCQYVEYWGPDKYTIKINNTIARYPDGSPMEGRNIFGAPPAVYIPHLRKTKIYGDSLIVPLENPVLEFNARAADVSRAAQKGSELQYWGTNLTGTAETIYVGSQKVYHLGGAMETRLVPDIKAFERPSNIADTQSLTQWLWDLTLHMASVPKVALGVDEGSQRSGQTLRARFWALRSHASMERTFATSELNRLAQIAIMGMTALGYPGSGPGIEDLSASQDWPEMLPQDRAEVVNEMVQRKAAGLVSLMTSLRAFGDYEDLATEMQSIQDETQASIQQAQKQSAPQETGENDGERTA